MSQAAVERVPNLPRRTGSTVYVSLLAIVAALGGLLFGYDTAVISGAIGFLRLHFDLDPQWTAGWAATCALLGCAIGAGIAGMISDWLGRKKVLMLCAVAFLVSALGTAFPQDFTQFIVFRIIGGLAIGAASMSSPMYIAEISPARIRGRMVSVNQFAIVSGMLIVYFVNYYIAAHGSHLDQQAAATVAVSESSPLDADFARAFITRYAPQIEADKVDEFLAQPGAKDVGAVAGFLAKHDVVVAPETVALARGKREPWNEATGWRWMFGSGAFPSLLLLVLLFLVPESPRWLAKQGRRDEAVKILTRVGGTEQAQRELAEIEETIAHESGFLGQLFQPGIRMALVIGVTLAVFQQVTGINVFLYFATEIFKKMGAGTDAALLQTVLVGTVNMMFTIIALWTVDRTGRKPLMLIGSVGMAIALLAMGAAAYLQRTETWVLLFILGYIACFALSVGPVTWVILSEIFPTRIRGRAMAMATVCLWVANFIVTQTFTMMDANPWLVAMFHRAFPFWLYALLSVASVLFVWRFVPETKGKTLEAIERSWHKTADGIRAP